MAVRRVALQIEAYGLSAGQRQNGADAMNSFFDGEAVEEVLDRQVDPSKVVRGNTLLFVEADFTLDGTGGRMFDRALTWLSTRSEDAPGGVHSYVRLKTVDDTARTITTRYAESPAWVYNGPTVSSLDATVAKG